MSQLRELKDEGAALVESGKLEAALAVYEKALALAPMDVAVRQNLAEVQFGVGRAKDAIATLEWVCSEYAKNGHLLRAIAVARRILEIDPKHRAPLNKLADLYSQQPPVSSAAATLASAVSAPTGPVQTPALPQRAISTGARSVSGEFDLRMDLERPTPGKPKPFPLFSSLDRAAFLAMIEAMELRGYDALHSIVKEGDVGQAMYAIVDGTVNVVRNATGEQRVIAQMEAGNFFGEIALIADAPRLASVVTVGPCTVLELTRVKMDALVAKHPQLGEVMQAFYRERLLANVLRSSPLFSDLSAEAKTDVARAFTVRTAQPGEELVHYGATGDTLFLLLRGRCMPFHPQPGGRETKYPEMTEGDIFGEISLLLGKAATASVRAVTVATLLCLSRPDFERLVVAHPSLRSRLMQMSFDRLQRTAKVLSGRFI